VHWASFAPRDPPRTPTTKDFAVEGRPVEIAQPPWLTTPDRPEQRRDKIDALPLHQRDQVLSDGARLPGVVPRIGDNRGAVSTRQAERIPQMFGVGCVERLARNVAVSGGIHFRVEIAQPDINPERSQAAAERAIAAARIERDSWEIKI
jgi:hypothetical protein